MTGREQRAGAPPRRFSRGDTRHPCLLRQRTRAAPPPSGRRTRRIADLCGLRGVTSHGLAKVCPRSRGITPRFLGCRRVRSRGSHTDAFLGAVAKRERGSA